MPANIDVRTAIMANGLKCYEVAEELGMYDTHFSKLLRTEMSADKKEKVLHAINSLAEKKKEGR